MIVESLGIYELCVYVFMNVRVRVRRVHVRARVHEHVCAHARVTHRKQLGQTNQP